MCGVKEVLATLVGLVLVLASIFGVPTCLLLAWMGFSGQLADAGQALNTEAGIVYLGLAVAIALATVGWIKYVVYKT
jgi:hypothetical protein